MKLLFIQAFLDKNYDSLSNKLIVIAICWILVIFAMTIDLISGCHKAKQRGEYRSSAGFKRTVSKFIMYISALALAFMADCLFDFVITSFNSFIPAIPYLTIVVSLYIIIAVEGRSVLEKASDKERKQLSKDALMAFELISKIKDQQVIEKLIEIAKEKNECATN